ncbi:murein biosynthesis integral membrane protein MurJ [Calorimonas adulescens]|uniref:Probable lipid II flippase MurJ n=1 Tax=Calorimonas adulescens TaxID=2606906 RepID=A0A5D8QBI9_9THEO|nr:murein biosynthesis integral membrane protein MurJ [Calorimonas adulescens]TZE81717.1 murein biosynthesis integral membrane protein MurJ [Calorimonas adulescens]
MDTEPHRTATRAAGLLMVTITASRILGFIRETTVANIFGTSYVTDAFYAAFTIPDLMYYLLIGGALSSGFIPVFTSYLANNREKEGWEVASIFISVVLCLLVVVTILGIIFAPYLVPLVAYKFRGETLALTIRLTRIMFSAVMMTAIAGLESGILNSYQEFTASAFGPIVYNIGIILGAVMLGTRFGVYGLAVGVVAGAFGNVLTQFFSTIRHAKGFFKFNLDVHNEGFKQIIALVIPALIGLSISQINLVVNQNIASGLAEGSITALRYANRLFQLPLGIFAMAISTAFFPSMTRQASIADYKSFKSTLSLGLRSIFFITIPSGVGLIVLSKPIVRLLFKSGSFTESDVAATAFALGFYSLGLFAHSAIQVITRGYYSIKDTRTPVIIGAMAVAFNVILNLIFVRYSNLALGGIAFSFSLSGILNMVVLLYILNKRLNGIETGRILMTIIKSTVSSLVMGAAAYYSYVYLSSIFGIESKLNQLIHTGGSIIIGVIVFAAMAYILRMDELNVVLDIIKRRIKK